MKKKLLLIMPLVFMAAACDKVDNTNQNQMPLPTFTRLDNDLSLCINYNSLRFRNYTDTTTREQYETVYYTKYSLSRSTTEPSSGVIYDYYNNYYYTTSVYSSNNVYNEVLLGNCTTTTSLEHYYLILGQNNSSIMVKKITTSSTSYSYESGLKNFTVDLPFESFLNSNWSNYFATIQSLQTALPNICKYINTQKKQTKYIVANSKTTTDSTINTYNYAFYFEDVSQ